MTENQSRTLVEMVLYVLDKTGGADIYHLLKILYFAEQRHLREWGLRMIPDDFHAYEYGPVPERLYKALRHRSERTSVFGVMLDDAVYSAGYDATDVLLPRRAADTGWLSKAAIACLDASAVENAALTFNQLLDKSHDAAWSEARRRGIDGLGDKMCTISIARAAGTDEALLQLVEEHAEAEAMLA